jgi:hypothetical protein
LRRGLAIAEIADRMSDGPHGERVGKYKLISELLSAYGYAVGDESLENYAAKARVHLRTYPSRSRIDFANKEAV